MKIAPLDLDIKKLQEQEISNHIKDMEWKAFKEALPYALAMLFLMWVASYLI
jgi:hypothetical protein